MAVESFGIEKEFLKGLLVEVQDGSTRLPDFQRSWVWPDRNIISLIASVSLGYPVGTVMMLRTGGEVRFQQRPVQGAEGSVHRPATRLILDGQQRLTSLFQALLLGEAVRTIDVRRKPVTGWFYIDIAKALDPHTDREEAIRFLPEDRIVKNFRGEAVEDYSTPEAEYDAGLFPLAKIFEPDDWYMAYQEHWGYDRDRIKLWNAFHRDVVDSFKQYQVPVIELGASTAKEAVCQVFEKVNTGGVTLTVFELLTATYAADEFKLREDWDAIKRQWADPQYKILGEVSNTDFLQAVSLLATRQRRLEYLAIHPDDERSPRIGCKRSDMLALTLDEYRRFAPLVVEGMKRAAVFLHRQYLYDTKFLPYGSQLIPLSAILAVAGSPAESASAQEKLARWFWCGVFGELYGGSTETRFSRDLPDVLAWIGSASASEPRTVTEAQFAPGRLLTLRTRGSAAYKGIYALLMAEGALDWRTGDPSTIHHYFDAAVDIHHVFPKVWAESAGIDPKIFNCIINKTPLSARTNRVIGGHAPSDYMARLQNSAEITEATLDGHVSTHLAEPKHMRADDFDAFFEARRVALLSRIGTAMGKPIDLGPTEAIEVVEDEDDDN